MDDDERDDPAPSAEVEESKVEDLPPESDEADAVRGGARGVAIGRVIL